MLHNTYYNLIVCLSNKYSLGSHKRLLKILPFTKLLNGIVLKICFHKEVYHTVGNKLNSIRMHLTEFTADRGNMKSIHV